MNYHFEWDPEKASSNLRKHGISFEKATEIFLNPLQLAMQDNEHGAQGERWITLGRTRAHKLQVVVHTFITYQPAQITIRIISARPATRHERNQYEDS
ncbi:MAG: BrnT family toxin [Methyloprofundus sp.]|nr:BrnT family toxin [Methyloprofundus sp.]